jgi:WD40 repeat protein
VKSLVIGLLLAILPLGCGRRSRTEAPGEIVPIQPTSWTSSMALMVSISDNGEIGAKVTADGIFVLANLAQRTVIWKRDVKGRCVHAVAVDPGGEFIAYPFGCGRVSVEEIATGRRDEYVSPAGDRDIHAIAVGRRGYPLAFGACGQGVYYVGSPTSSPQELHPLGGCADEFDYVSSLSISADGRTAVAGWACAAKEDRPAVHTGWVGGDVNSNGTAATVWSLPSSSPVGRIRWKCNLSFATAALSPDNATLVVGGVNNSVTAWDLETGGRKWGPATHSGYELGFVLNGRFLLTVMPSALPPDPQVFVLAPDSGRTLASVVAGSDIMTRGDFAGAKSDTFLIAHRTGRVDVYRVSADGLVTKKIWDF